MPYHVRLPVGPLESEDMDSALRPREIQARIRSGQSLEEVAREAGVPAERIEAYAAPVIAERDHIARTALAATVRRRGETSTHRNLRPVVEQRLTSAGVDPDGVDWDAWREEDRRWTVRARYQAKGSEREGLFRYDQAGRFSVALNDDARWLIGEATQEQEDSDELALVRAVSSPEEVEDVDAGDVDEGDVDEVEDEPEGSDEVTQPIADRATDSRRSGAGEPGSNEDGSNEDESHEGLADEESLPTSAATPQEIASEVEAEIDSYGVVPDGRSELDVLYDMLGGMAEDSINIYAGLSEPVLDEAPRQGAAPGGDAPREEEIVEVTEVEVVEVTEVELDDEQDEDEPTNVRIPRPAAATDPDAGRPEATEPGPTVVDRGEDDATEDDATEDEDAEPAQPIRRPARNQRGATKARPVVEPEQPSLVDHLDEQESAGKPAPAGRTETPEPEPADSAADQRQESKEQDSKEPEQKPAAKQRKSRKRRASVPSWDEIMFGGPPPNTKE